MHVKFEEYSCFSLGSSGTRTYVYRWLPSQAANTLKQLASQRWRPGLSSHAALPVRERQEAVAADIRKVLTLAGKRRFCCSACILLPGPAEHVPADLRSSTAVVLRATAGLRMLEEETTQR